MFKYFAVVFAALLAVVAAKPGVVAPVAYTAAAYPAAYSAYAAPALAAYSAPALAAFGTPYAAYSPYYAGYGAAYRYY